MLPGRRVRVAALPQHHVPDDRGVLHHQHGVVPQELPAGLRPHRRAHRRWPRHRDRVGSAAHLQGRLPGRGVRLPKRQLGRLLHRHRRLLHRPAQRAPPPGGVGLMSTSAIETGSFPEGIADQGPSRRARRRRSRTAPDAVNWWLTALLIVLAITIAIPLYFAVVTALKTTDQLGGTGFGLPHTLHWSNFADAWRLTNFPKAALNSALITVGAVV